MLEMPPPNPYGTCMCGCGKATPLARQTDYYRGMVKGLPIRFIHNHHGRKEVHHVVENRGYKTPCWIWQLTLTQDGYGRASKGRNPISAHRKYYEKYVGPIPKGLVLDHLCRVRCCVNPEHLEPVTPIENTRRGLNAKISPEDVLTIKELRKNGLTFKEIGRRFGITPSAVNLIHKGRNWKGLEL